MIIFCKRYSEETLERNIEKTTFTVGGILNIFSTFIPCTLTKERLLNAWVGILNYESEIKDVSIFLSR